MIIEPVAAPDETARAAIQAVIDPYNEAQLGYDGEVQRFAALVRHADGTVAGGALATTYWEWLFVNMIALPEATRGQGVGRRIMRTIEREAIRRGCRGIWLDTATYQAPRFYEKLGFVEFGRIPRYGPGWARHWMLRTPLTSWPDQDIAVTEDPDDAIRTTVRTVLMAHSDAQSGPGNPTSIAAVVRDAPGAPILGGYFGRFSRGWTFIELLALTDAVRGQGVGTRLMAMADEATRALGGRGIWLDTFSFQARPFYERLGYTCYGEIADYPPPHRRYFMARRLDGTKLLAESDYASAAGLE